MMKNYRNKILYILLMVSFCFSLFGESSQYKQHFPPYYSQEAQDKYLIENVFHFRRNGVFFDIGAHDGISYSNTYYFEKELGWNGICVEPHDGNFALLQKNRKCVCIHACIADKTGEKDFLKVSGAPEMLSGLVETYDPRQLNRVNKELVQNGGKKEIVKVKSYNFNELCKQNNISHIDYLSIDTEGSEELIIKSIDFDVVDIDLLTVENNFGDTKIRDYLVKKNYKFLKKIGADEIYVKNKSTKLLIKIATGSKAGTIF